MMLQASVDYGDKHTHIDSLLNVDYCSHTMTVDPGPPCSVPEDNDSHHLLYKPATTKGVLALFILLESTLTSTLTDLSSLPSL